MKKSVKKPVVVEKVVEKVTEYVEEIQDVDNGYINLLGKEVYVSCGNYAYTGVLIGVNSSIIEIMDPSIVYETGPWNQKNWKDNQRLPTEFAFVNIDHIESLFAVKRIV